MKKQTIKEQKLSMFQLIANHDEKKVTQNFIGSREDLYLIFGVAFENDPEFYETLKDIMETYDDFVSSYTQK
jgi:hypothetical protein